MVCRTAATIFVAACIWTLGARFCTTVSVHRWKRGICGPFQLGDSREVVAGMLIVLFSTTCVWQMHLVVEPVPAFLSRPVQSTRCTVVQYLYPAFVASCVCFDGL